MELFNDILKNLEMMNITSLQRAIKDGYVNISGNEGKRKITYVASENHS